MQNFAMAMALALLTGFLLSAIPTQWFAAAMSYDRGLGEPLWIGQTFAFYMPSDWVAWGWRLSDYEPLRAAVNRMTYMGFGAGGIGMGSGFFYAFLLGKHKTGMDELHGSAHWASTEEVDSTGFFPTKGRKVDGAMVGSVMLDGKGEVIHPMHRKFGRRYKKLMGWVRVGLFWSWIHLRDKDGVPRWQLRKGVVKRVELLRADDPTHILIFAPTRSGKGVGLVLPTLLTWRHAALVNDIKGENWALTSGFRRAAGQIVIKFEPASLDGSSAKWNPLDEIRLHTKQDVQDAQGIMMMVCDPKGEGLEDHWAKTSWEFLTGLALHLAYVGGPSATMAGMASYLGDPKWEDERQMYTTMLTETHDKDGKAGWLDTEGNPTRIHPAVANAAKTMLQKEDKERTSVLSTAKSFLSLYLDPVVAANTSRSDFLVRDLMNSDKPVSCYYVVQPADLERMVPLSRLFYAMVIRRNATDMEFAEGSSVQGYKHRLLLLIDELPALKKLSVLQEGLGYIAGYGIKCYLICQDLIQLEEAYGDKQTIVAGCHTRIAYAPNTQETADKLSAMTGKTTILEESASTSRSAWGMTSPNVSVSTNKTERELMTAAEFLALSPEDMVLFVAGRAPIYGRKIKYYEDKVMLKRAKMPAPKKSDVIRLPVAVGEAATGEEAMMEHAAAALKIREDANRAEWQKRMVAALNAADGKKPIGDATTKDGAVTVKPVGSGSSGDAETGSEASGGGDQSGRRRSFYSDRRATEITDEERQEIAAIVANTGLVERVAAISVF